MTRVTVKEERPEDFPEIHNLVQKSFKREDEADLVARLRSSEDYVAGLSLIAVDKESRILGHVMFSRMRIIGKEEAFSSLALAPMAVLPEYQRQGIGKLLVQKGLNKARSLNFDSVVVLGHPEYYPKFGFVPASRWEIKAPFEVPENVFLALELKEGGLQGKAGVVRYSRAFII